MCGIAGIVMRNGHPASTAEVKRMTDRMTYRGPDDEGFVVSGSAALGMRRLSIIGVESGHQPLTNEDRSLQLVFNGEIYNHLELRAALVQRGHRFRTDSDGEVILHLYEEEGTACLKRLNGMFALALVDARTDALWIARDRLGIKPLYYAELGDRLVFGSDITAIRSAYQTVVDRNAVVKYLALGYVPDDETLWRGVKKLLPGHQMWIERGAITISAYWTLAGIGQWRGSRAEAAEQLGVILDDAIRLQLRSDVPLGAFLSGG